MISISESRRGERYKDDRPFLQGNLKIKELKNWGGRGGKGQFFFFCTYFLAVAL